MINKNRLISLFTELVSIDNPSRHEKEMCERIKKELDDLNISYDEDNAGELIGGNAGNLYAYVDGDLNAKPIILSAHMDSVDPAVGKKAVVHPDGLITSEGNTVLGADDLSGVASILEAVRAVRESGKPHRPFELLFDVGEEIYCQGIKNFDFSRLKSDEAYVFDLTESIGTAAVQAACIIAFEAHIIGRAAHAAFNPNDGIHAIKTASEAISRCKLGKIGDTTINIGLISGGTATNVVPEECIIKGEARSFQNELALEQIELVRKEIEKACRDNGAEFTFNIDILFSAVNTPKDDITVKRFENACKENNLPVNLISTYGGSDNNYFMEKDVKGIVIACGMSTVHSCKETSHVNDLENTAKIIESLLLSDI